MPEERKLVTILFTDVTGSTALGEGLDPEDLRALMGRYYAHARRIVPEHGGTLEKFIGDAVMAVFGLPQAHSNDAERALAAALALRDAVANDGVIAGRLVLRLGVNTGQVVATTEGEDVARGDFLVTGDAVNVAARLEQSASPGEILVSARTAAATESSFVFGAPREISVKGKSQALGVYPLTAQRANRQLGRPALVGRQRDLAQLALLAERALEERRPQLVSIVAPAGTGKTRLLEEFLGRLEEGEGWRVATARCLPYGQTLTYWPLRGLLDELLGAPFSQQAVCAAFEQANYTSEDAQRLASITLTALGLETEAKAERETLFNAWRLLIEAFAKRAPRIIVFEDLHWASESLLDLVEHVMQPRTEAPLLIVATSRPELLDRRPAWGSGGRRSFTALVLDALNERDTRALVGAVAEGAPDELQGRIAQRSEGNPFFAIELARGVEAGDASGGLPDTIQEALQERLDALAPRERAVLQVAAVAGRAFRPATLRAAMNDRAPTEIEPALEGLLARDLITPAEDGSYTFRHILIRDVAYNTLSRAERIRLHLAVAHWLEDFAAERLDEFIELLAYHYAEAAQLARQSAVALELRVDVERAVSYLERAATLASQVGAYAEAKRHLERAIELAPETEHRRLYEALGDQLGLNDAVFPAFSKALDLWRREAQPDPLVGARLARKRYWALASSGLDHQGVTRAQMLEMREEMRRRAEAAGDEDEWWRMRVAEMDWFVLSGGLARDGALADMEQALTAAAHFEARGDWEAFHRALDLYAFIGLTMGAWDKGEAAARRRLGAPRGHVSDWGDAMTSLAFAQVARGAYAETLASVKAAVAGRRLGELIWPYALAIGDASLAAELSGAWEEFDALLSWQEEAWSELGSGEGLIMIQISYHAALQVALAREDRAAAEQAIASICQLNLKDEHWINRRWTNAYFDALLRDDPAPVLAQLASESETVRVLDWGFGFVSDPRLGHLRDVRFVSECGRPPPESFVALYDTVPPQYWPDAHNRCMAIARALAADDDAALAAAIDDAEAHGLIPHAARMRIVLAQRTGDRAQLERARPVLERLGDKLFLRKLAGVEAALG